MDLVTNLMCIEHWDKTGVDQKGKAEGLAVKWIVRGWILIYLGFCGIRNFDFDFKISFEIIWEYFKFDIF